MGRIKGAAAEAFVVIAVIGAAIAALYAVPALTNQEPWIPVTGEAIAAHPAQDPVEPAPPSAPATGSSPAPGADAPPRPPSAGGSGGGGGGSGSGSLGSEPAGPLVIDLPNGIQKVVDNGRILLRDKAHNSQLLELELLDNTGQCLIDCSATIRLRAYADLVLPAAPTADYAWDFLGQQPAESRFELLAERTETVPSLSWETVTVERARTNSTVPSGCTALDGETLSCEESRATPTTSTRTVRAFKPFSFWNSTLPAGEHVLRVRGNKPLGSAVDWVPTFYGAPITEWAWWNGSWEYATPVTVTEQSNYTLFDYPIIVPFFTCPGTCASDGADIRVTASQVQELPFGLLRNPNGSFNLTFHVNVSALGQNSSYFIHSGNALARAANSSWNKTRYNWYDDFDTGSFATEWNVSESGFSFTNATRLSGNYSLEGNGEIHYQPLNVSGTANGPSVLVSGKIRFPGPDHPWDGYAFGQRGSWNQLHGIWGANHYPGYVLRIDSYNSTGGYPQGWSNSGFSNSGCSVSPNNWYGFSARFSPGPDAGVQLWGENCPSFSWGPGEGAPTWGYAGIRSDYHTFHDDVSIRLYTDPEPAVSIGIPQNWTATAGVSALLTGIRTSAIAGNHTILNAPIVYVVDRTGAHSRGFFDLLVRAGNQSWALSSVLENETFANLSNLTPYLTAWESRNLTEAQITAAVAALINNTRSSP